MASELTKAVWVGALALALTGSAAWPAGAQETDTPRNVTKRLAPFYTEFEPLKNETVEPIVFNFNGE